MRKSYRFLFALLIAGLFSLAANAQKVTIKGTVNDTASNQLVPAVSVIEKGTNNGTYTDSRGEYSLVVSKLPVVLVFSSIGYETQEVTVSDASANVNVDFKVTNALGQEVVVAANRVPTRILEAPVTVERLSSTAIRNLPSPTVYEAL